MMMSAPEYVLDSENADLLLKHDMEPSKRYGEIKCILGIFENLIRSDSEKSP
jgi:hypothetical protein